MRSPVAVVIYTDTHTYKQKVLLYSKFMFNSKATANGNRHVREYLEYVPTVKELPDVAVAVRSYVAYGNGTGRTECMHAGKGKCCMHMWLVEKGDIHM